MRFLLITKVSTLLGNTAHFFSRTVGENVFSAFPSWLVKPKMADGHLGAAKTA